MALQVVLGGEGAALVRQMAARAMVASVGVRMAAAAAAAARGGLASQVRAPPAAAAAVAARFVQIGAGGGGGPPRAMDGWERWQMAQAGATPQAGASPGSGADAGGGGSWGASHHHGGGSWGKAHHKWRQGEVYREYVVKRTRGGPFKRELLVLKNGILAWWREVKEAGRYLRVLSLPPALAPPRVIAESPVVDPFPSLATVRDSRYLLALGTDVGKGTVAALTTLFLNGGVFLLAAVNYFWPRVLPTGFAASRASYLATFSPLGAERPTWRWRDDDVCRVPYYAPGAPSAPGTPVNGSGGAAGKASPWDVVRGADGATPLTNMAVILALSDAGVLTLARDVLAAMPPSAAAGPDWTAAGGDVDGADGSGSDAEAMSISGRVTRLARLVDELPRRLTPAFSPIIVPLDGVRTAAAAAGRDASTIRALRFALAKYFDKVQVDDALLRREALTGTGLFADLPGAAAAASAAAGGAGAAANLAAVLPPIRLEDCYVRNLAGDVRIGALPDLPPTQRALAELAAVADQRLVPATLRRTATTGAQPVLIGDALAGLHHWLRVSQTAPVAVMYLQQARPMA